MPIQTDFIKDLMKDVKTDLFEKLDYEIRKDDRLKMEISKIDIIRENLEKFDKYIDEQLIYVESKYNIFVEKFDLKKVKIESDIIVLFDIINDTDNVLLSSFIRNNTYNKEIMKLKDILIRLLLRIYKSKGLIADQDTRGRSRNQTLKIIEDDGNMVLLNDVLDKFKNFFENYQEISMKIKNKGFLLKEYYNFLMFTRGNG